MSDAPRPFHIATIANDPSVYADMRRSMDAFGYTEALCRFSLFDNSQSNRFEPFEVLRQLPADGDEPYVVLCHQDLRFDADSSATVLLDRLKQLDARDPNWAVAGTAGMNTGGMGIVHLNDPNGKHRAADLPQRVLTLDESFLVIRRDRFPQISPGLAGFHLYGTDLCLNAMLVGHTAYVIELPLTHLSGGVPSSPEFHRLRQLMIERWRQPLWVGLIYTTCTELRVSRRPVIERLLQRPLVYRFFRHYRLATIRTLAAVLRGART